MADKKEKKSKKDRKAELDDFDMEKELAEITAQPETPKTIAKPADKVKDTAVPQNGKEDDADDKKSKGKKTKKGKKNAGDSEDEENNDTRAETKESAAVVEQDNNKDKTKKGKKGKKQLDDDFDMEKELQELEHAEPVKPAKPADKPVVQDAEENDQGDSKQKGKKSKKNKKQLEDDFDMEKELAEAEAAPSPAAASEKARLKPAAEPDSKPAAADKKKKGAEPAKAETATDDAPPSEAKKAEKAGSAKGGKEDDKKKPVNKQKELMKEHLRKIQEERERFQREEEERIRKEEEEEQNRLDALQKEKERKEREKQKKKERQERLKAEGKLLTAKEKQAQARAQAMLESLKAQGVTIGEKAEKGAKKPPKKLQTQESEDKAKEQDQKAEDAVPAEEQSEAESEESLDDWDAIADKEVAPDGSAKVAPFSRENSQTGESSASAPESPAVELPTAKAFSSQKVGNLRSAVVCVLGHVDTGKTKILDKIRRTNVQDNEAGGITQQIGATMVPQYAIQAQSAMVRGFNEMELRLPGLLIIDTPGHESFSNLRSRGSSLCDIAILVVDIMHGLEPQTIESLNMLKSRKTPFIVALNKIDRLFGWKSMPKLDIRDAMEQQAKNVQLEFKTRCQETVVQFAQEGLNAAVFYDNPDPKTYISMVPTSAHSGDGMGNLMGLIVEMCQNMLSRRLTFSNDLQCTVLEVKELTGLGTTVDVILTNGTLHEGDTIVVAGFEGPIMTQVRGLLMPQPMRELRVKNPYEKHKVVHGAQGVKIVAKDLETCLAGLPLYVANTPEDQERYKSEIEDQLESALKSIQRSDKGVYVQASTLGSLEALLEFLRTSKIPYCGINIGPVHKKDVKIASVMKDHQPEYAVILAFDVKIERDAQLLADELGVRIFAADIIYHLFDRFTQYREELMQRKRDEHKHLAIFPCKLKILPQFIFSTRDPIICGVVVEQGVLKTGTPICVPSKEFVDIGIVTSMELNHKSVDIVKKGQEVCAKIEPIPGETPKLLGRHFEETDQLVSKISRASIDVCKEYFRDDLSKDDWRLMVELKNLMNIM